MGRKLSNVITPAEEQELEQLLAQDPELWYSYELIQAVNSMDDVTEEFVDEIKSLLDGRAGPEKLNAALLHKLQDTAGEPALKSSSKFKTVIRFAAVFVCIIALTWAGLAIFRPAIRNKALHTAMNEIVAPKGSKTQITLADGTTIWLNAGSKLTYPKNFSLENREVYLVGEAYFKVVHHDKYFFIVHTPEADIKDLGTTFNVKAYTGALTTETTLIEGSIEVSLKNDPDRKILISPNEKLVLHNKRQPAKKGPAPAEPVLEVTPIVPFQKTNEIVETAWVDNKLIFRDERFVDLAAMMERRYNVSILIKNDDVKAYQLTGIFKNESVEEALKLLQVIAPFKFTINNEQIIIDK